MVRLASYLVADSLDSYRADHIDGDNVECVFDPAELEEACVQAVYFHRPDVTSSRMGTRVLPLNEIERSPAI